MNFLSSRRSTSVLVVDDDSSTRILLRLVLQKDGYEVIEAENGRDCIKAFIEFQPDLVLLDAMMPVMDGFTCCEKIRQIIRQQTGKKKLGIEQIPVLMITGLDDKNSVDRAFEAGAIDYVTKPIHPPVLLRRLRRFLEVQWTNQILQESEKKYRLLVNNLKEIVFQTNSSGILTFLNPAWETITGYSLGQSLGHNLTQFIYPTDIPIHELVFESLREQQQEDYNYQIRYLRANQEIGWLEIYAYPLIADGQKLLGIAGTINNITERKLRETYQKIETSIIKALAESDCLEIALKKIISILCVNLKWELGEFWCLKQQENLFNCLVSWHLPLTGLQNTLELNNAITLNLKNSFVQKIWFTKRPIWISNSTQKDNFSLDFISSGNFNSAMGFSILDSQEKLGIIILYSQQKRQSDTYSIQFFTSLSSQIGQFIRRKQTEIKLQQQHLLLQAELNQAASYVRSLLPDTSLPESIYIEQRFIPSIQLGGDIFDYYWLDDNCLAIYLLDVAGHGISSALLSVSVRNILRSQSLYNTDFYEPWTVISELNRTFQMDERGENYFTIWYGVYDLATRELIYCSAGHPPAILLETDQSNVVKQLVSDNIAVGMLPEFDFEQNYCQIKAGHSLYIFSDGIYEIEQDQGMLWGFEAFTTAIVDFHQELELLLAEVKNINGKDSFDDDISIMKISFS